MKKVLFLPFLLIGCGTTQQNTLDSSSKLTKEELYHHGETQDLTISDESALKSLNEIGYKVENGSLIANPEDEAAVNESENSPDTDETFGFFWGKKKKKTDYRSPQMRLRNSIHHNAYVFKQKYKCQAISKGGEFGFRIYHNRRWHHTMNYSRTKHCRDLWYEIQRHHKVFNDKKSKYRNDLHDIHLSYRYLDWALGGFFRGVGHKAYLKF